MKKDTIVGHRWGIVLLFTVLLSLFYGCVIRHKNSNYTVYTTLDSINDELEYKKCCLLAYELEKDYPDSFKIRFNGYARYVYYQDYEVEFDYSPSIKFVSPQSLDFMVTDTNGKAILITTSDYRYALLAATFNKYKSFTKDTIFHNIKHK